MKGGGAELLALDRALEARGVWLCDVNPDSLGVDEYGRLQVPDAAVYSDAEWEDPVKAHYGPLYRKIGEAVAAPLMQRSLASLWNETGTVLEQFNSGDHALLAVLDAGCEYPLLPWTTRVRGRAKLTHERY